MSVAADPTPAGKPTVDPVPELKPDRRFPTLLVVAGVIGSCGWLMWHRNLLTPDQFLIFALVGAILLGRLRSFLWDWMPLTLLLFGYEYVRGLVPIFNDKFHALEMIRFDQAVFGKIPTVALQTRYFNPGQSRWYDYAAVALYLAHFVVPLTVAFLFWLRNRRLFKEYAAGMVLLSYMAYLTYLAYPAVPPWMASKMGLLPDVKKILDVTFHSFRTQVNMPTVYRFVGANLVAAVPSLHAAYPLLTGLYVCRVRPKLTALVVIYILSVWVAVIYLGEHYVFDVVAGALYALAAYWVVQYGRKQWERRKSRIRPTTSAIDKLPAV